MNELDGYLERFGAQVRATKPPPRRSEIAATTLLALAAIVVATLLLVPGGGTRPSDAVAAVTRALDPDGVILHMRVLSDASSNAGGIRHSYQESWTTDAPQRWRVKQWTIDGSRKDEMTEESYFASNLSLLDRGTLSVQRGLKDHTAQSAPPTIFTTAGGRPDRDLRALLESGRVRDLGEARSDGRVVRRLSHEDQYVSITIDVDPRTFVPLGGSITHKPRLLSLEQATAIHIRFKIEAFERLPRTAANERLLRITTPPGTKLAVQTAREARPHERGTPAGTTECRPGRDDTFACPWNAAPHANDRP